MTQLIKGAVFGHVVGDALGVPVEFLSREKLAASPVTEMLGGRSHRMPKGTWSDDSSMMLCTLISLTEMGEPDDDDMMLRFSQWIRNGYMTPYGKPFGIGRTTLKAIEKFLRGESAANCGCRSERDNGNGSLMRILPAALYHILRPDTGAAEKEKLESIHQISALTHAHERSCMACGIFTFVLKELAAVRSKRAVLSGLKRAAEFYRNAPEFKAYRCLLSDDFASLDADDIFSSGYVVDTLEAAVWCLLNTDDYKTCMLKAVNLGGDTDTIAAVAGGLAGLLYGYDAIPEEWLGVLAKKDEIAELCERFANSL